MILKIFSSFLITNVCLGFSLGNFGEEENKPFICSSSAEPDTSDPEVGPRSFLLSKYRQWPRGVIPFEVDSSFSQNQIRMIELTMRKFSEVSCVRWVQRISQKDYVRFLHVSQSNTCNSVVGRQGGRQVLNLGDKCFDVKHGYQGALLHEMMHAIGFIHEQQRVDRDCYVWVSEIAKESKPFDYKVVGDTSTAFPYDFSSIMHYGTSNSLMSWSGERMGNFAGEFTKMDIVKINNMYCGGMTFCQLEPEQCAYFQTIQNMCWSNAGSVSNSRPIGKQ